CRVAVGVIFSHAIAHDAGALPGGPVGLQTHLLHGVENPPMDRLQAIANIGKGAAHDYAHGVIEIRPLHLVFNVDGNEVLVPAITGREQRALGWILICQNISSIGQDKPEGLCRQKWVSSILTRTYLPCYTFVDK